MGWVDRAYGVWADRYAEVFGDAAAVHETDLAVVRSLAARSPGPVLDAGCGPGHLTAVLHDAGARASGLDLTPEFVAIARARHPQPSFRVGSLTALDAEDGSLGGVLAWYSLIHLPPAEVAVALQEFRRVLRPGGLLLTGFFDGPSVAPFAHRVTTAHFWPVATMAAALEHEGFAVLLRQRRTDPGRRPHGAVLARRS